MHHLWRLATRNWWDSPGRTTALLVSVAVGVGAVVVVTSLYETARRTIESEVVTRWLGNAHLTVHPLGAHWGALDASFANEIAQIGGIRHVTARLRRRGQLILQNQTGQLLPSSWTRVDLIGIEPGSERHFRVLPNLQGRQIHLGETGVTVIEQQIPGYNGLVLGDEIIVLLNQGGEQLTLEIVGFFDSERVADFQSPDVFLALGDLQNLAGQPGSASVIDVMLENPTPSALAGVKEHVERLISERQTATPYRVTTAEGRLLVLLEADRITRLVLMLAAFVCLLTSFFIILTTMSMSLYQRRASLGMMRCVGLTRSQLCGALFLEILPLGVFGTLLGIGLGVATTSVLSAWASDENITVPIFLSPWGMYLAAGSGFLTTVLCTLALIIQIGRVTPLAAVHVEAQPARRGYAVIAGVVGVALLILHEKMVGVSDQTRWLQPGFVSLGTGSLYLGYACLAPALVLLVGRPIARLVGPLLRIRGSLAADQIGQSPWRATGVCWVLMVGLSLIVYISIGAEVVRSVWDFPARLPEAFVWSPQYVRGDAIDRVRELPGISRITLTTDIDCELTVKIESSIPATQSLIERFLRKLTRPVFVGGDIDAIFESIKIVFLEGSEPEARELLAKGGYVLVPIQTAKHHELHLGDRVNIKVGDSSHDFEIAGVIQSPALDLAVTAFRAESYMEFAAASAILGTRADMKEKFGLDLVAMFMCDLDLPKVQPPAEFYSGVVPDFTKDRQVAEAMRRWAAHLPYEREMIERIEPALRTWLDGTGDEPPPLEIRRELRRFAKAMRWVGWFRQDEQPETRWESFRERLLLLRIAEAMDRPDAIIGSVRKLRQMVVESIRRGTIVLTWLPSLALLVAAVGVGNLMMVSVNIRSRQIAVLRAVGALKSQIVRLVLAEAFTLGVLGCIMGLALGMHEAYSDNRITAGLIGFRPEFVLPLGTIGTGAALTIGICLVAGIGPARYAARENIVAAMQTT